MMAGRDPLANPEPLMRRVYAYIAYRVGDRTEAEDLTSETFERAVRYRSSFDAARGEPVAWLLGIARNCIYDAKLHSTPTPSPNGAVPAVDGVESLVVERVSLAQALATLVDRDRELLALRYGADLTPREIAALLEQRTNTVEVALSRARSRLAAALERAEEPADVEVGLDDGADVSPRPL